MWRLSRHIVKIIIQKSGCIATWWNNFFVQDGGYILPRGYLKIIIKQAAISPLGLIIIQYCSYISTWLKSFLCPRWWLSRHVVKVLYKLVTISLHGLIITQYGSYLATWLTSIIQDGVYPSTW